MFLPTKTGNKGRKLLRVNCKFSSGLCAKNDANVESKYRIMYKMKQIFATVLCVLVYLHTISGKHNQRPDPIKSSERHGRKLIRDTDFRKCFDIDYKKGYADYLLNPFKANDDRGDWGNLNLSAAVVLLLLIFLNSSNRKMPELLFGAMW